MHTHILALRTYNLHEFRVANFKAPTYAFGSSLVGLAKYVFKSAICSWSKWLILEEKHELYISG